MADIEDTRGYGERMGYGAPEAIPMPSQCTEAQLRVFAADGDLYSLAELERRGITL